MPTNPQNDYREAWLLRQPPELEVEVITIRKLNELPQAHYRQYDGWDVMRAVEEFVKTMRRLDEAAPAPDRVYVWGAHVYIPCWRLVDNARMQR